MSIATSSLDSWAASILADSLDKSPMVQSADGESWLNEFARRFPIRNGICDFRLLNNRTTNDQETCRQGQEFFEAWDQENVRTDDASHYRAEGEVVVWHPSFEELRAVIAACGFKIGKVYWQKEFGNSVCYIQAAKHEDAVRN